MEMVSYEDSYLSAISYCCKQKSELNRNNERTDIICQHEYMIAVVNVLLIEQQQQ